jgi:hypothetical protein
MFICLVGVQFAYAEGMGFWANCGTLGYYSNDIIFVSAGEFGVILPIAWIGIGTEVMKINSSLFGYYPDFMSYIPVKLFLFPILGKDRFLKGTNPYRIGENVHFYMDFSNWASITEALFSNSKILDVGVGYSLTLFNYFPISIKFGYLNLFLRDPGREVQWFWKKDETLYLRMDIGLLGISEIYGNVLLKKQYTFAPWIREISKGISGAYQTASLKKKEEALRREQEKEYKLAQRRSALKIESINIEDDNGDSILQPEEKAKVSVEVRNGCDEKLRGVIAYLSTSTNEIGITESPVCVDLNPGDVTIFTYTIRAISSLTTGEAILNINIFEEARISSVSRSFSIKTVSDLDITGKPALPPYPITKLTIIPQTGVVNAGETLKLELTIENRGKGELYGLLGKIISPSKYLNGKKFPFGMVKPGEKEELIIEVPISHIEKTQKVPFEIVFSEYNNFMPDPIQTAIYIEELPLPQFVYSYQTIDDMSGNSVGNGDGIIQKGEAIDLLFTIKNVGVNPAKNLKAIISSEKVPGLILAIPQVNVGGLEPGKDTLARLTFTTDKSYKEKKVSLQFHLEDDYWGISQVKNIQFPLEEALRGEIIEIRQEVVSVVPELKIHGGAKKDTPLIASVEKGGILLVTGQLGDWYRVELSEGIKGWIPADSVTFAGKKIKDETEGGEEKIRSTIIKLFEQTPPKIALFTPTDDKLKTTLPKLKLQGLITDDKKIDSFIIKINGEEIFSRGLDIVKKTELQNEIKLDVELPIREGSNIISLIAVDSDGLSIRKDLFVECMKETIQIWACVIGISKYNVARPNLKYAAADALSFYEYLIRDLGVPKDHIWLLLDEQATQFRVKEALGEFLKSKAGETDQIIIYFAGHGAVEDNPQSPDGDGLSKYLLTWDTDPGKLYSTGFPMDEVANIFSRIRAERKVFIADTCYSGASGGRTIFTRSRRTTISDNFLNRLSEGKGWVVLAASKPNEISIEDEKIEHGVFTFFLLKGLRGEADYDNDSFITIDEIYSYLSKKVPEATGQIQHPVKKGDVEGRLILGKR